MLRIGSRGSALALWQAHHIQDRLRALGEQTEIIVIKTTGDRIQDVPLNQVGTKGLFTKEIEEALLANEIDLAVHSLKDMPTELPERLILSAFPVREDPRDALVIRSGVAKGLADLPSGARVGTSSLRRTAQLKAVRPDLHLEAIRGNVDTRLRKLDSGEYDALLLASAGLHRLGFRDRITGYLDIEVMVPAVGQGALAIETRDDQGAGHRVAQQLNDAATERCVLAERAVLAEMGGGCQVPLGAHAWIEQSGELRIVAAVAWPDGSGVLRETAIASKAEDPRTAGSRLGQRLLASGARGIMDAVYKSE